MRARGLTLVECLVAFVVSSVLVAAIDASLVAGQRFAHLSAAARSARQNLRAAAAVLRGELESVSPAADLVALADSAVRLRALRAAGVVCAVSSPGTVVLDDSRFSQLRTADPARDSVRVFVERDPFTASDDGWIAAAVLAVRRASCPGGAAATALTLGAAPSDLAGIAPGAPLRVFELVEYRRYRDAAGAWWLGIRNASSGGWSAMSPVAGPLRPAAGLVFRYVDHRLLPTGVPDSVALVEADIQIYDARRLSGPGRHAAPVVDSFTLRVATAEP